MALFCRSRKPVKRSYFDTLKYAYVSQPITSFNDFMNVCGKTLNHHSLDIASSFGSWKKLFDKVRSGSKEKLSPGISQPVVQGITTYGLSDEEAFFILSYTASFSSWINSSLRNGDCLTECQDYYANGLELALSKLPRCNCKYVYRMDEPLRNKTEELKWFESKKGRLIKIPCFLSVAKSNWDNTELTWKISTVSNRSNVIDLAQCRNNSTEDEAVFKRDSLFEIKGVKGELIILQEVESAFTPVIEMVGNYVGCRLSKHKGGPATLG